MMAKPALSVLFFPDLLGWELEALEPFEHILRRTFSVTTLRVTRADMPSILSELRDVPVWVLAQGSSLAAKMFPARQSSPIYFSVLGWHRHNAFLPNLFFKTCLEASPRHFRWVAHCPMSYRFLREIEKKESVYYLPLPVSRELDKRYGSCGTQFRVGTLARFTSESNLNYFLTVAHYVMKKTDSVRFQIIGEGPLDDHLSKMIDQMGLGKCVQVAHDGAHFLGELDALLYLPLQNHHFLPLHLAASYGLSVIACETPGLVDYVEDSRSGFVVPMYDTKTMAELVLRLANDDILNAAIAKNFRERLAEKFSIDKLDGIYRAFFNPEQSLAGSGKALLDEAA